MPNHEPTESRDAWLATTSEATSRAASTLTVDELHRMALPLDPDERLRLVARLWKSLPADHRAALLTLQMEDARDPLDATEHFAVSPPIEPFWPKVRERLFDRSHASGLYSAPRRFDLATIFVVTAAYSLLLGSLTALDRLTGPNAAPLVKIAIGGLVAIIAATQAMFLHVANPRGVSIVTGAVAYTLMSWIIWLSDPYFFIWNSFIFVTFINGIIGGGILGYLLGTLVGGVFLVADVLRGKFEGRSKSDDSSARAEEVQRGDTV
jgi:hypothetical protein